MKHWGMLVIGSDDRGFLGFTVYETTSKGEFLEILAIEFVPKNSLFIG